MTAIRFSFYFKMVMRIKCMPKDIDSNQDIMSNSIV